MGSFITHRSLLSLFLLFQVCLSVELVPVRPSQGVNGGSGRLARRELTSLQLRSTESFLWENPGNKAVAIANFTVLAPGDHENVLSMERFDGLIKSTICTSTKLILEFDDKEAFTYAQKVWDWVNGADNHTFIMVAGSGDCGNNVGRIPYRVSAILYDETHYTATLSVSTGAWKDIVHSYYFQAGSAAPAANSGVVKRDEGRGISLAQEFPLKFKVQRGSIIGELECDNCRTTGNIGYGFDIRHNVIGLPNAAVLKIDPTGVSAVAGIKLTLESEFNSKTVLEPFEHPILSIPLNGWSINGVFEIGPYLDIVAGIEFVAFKGGIVVKTGATVSLDDSAYLEADLLNFSKPPTATGWTPKFKTDPLVINANVATQVQFYLTPKVRIKAEGLDLLGVQTGIEIKSIPLEAKLEASVALKGGEGGGVCGDKSKNFGISASYASGFEVMWTAGKSTGNDKPAFEKTFGTKMWEWPFKTCFACNNANGDGCELVDEKNPPKWVDPPPSPSTKSSTAKATAGTTTKCKTKKAISGTCISTTSCSNTGGVSEAGHCPGAANIQCCTYPDGSGDFCTASGINGVCRPTASCKAGRGASIPGHCRGSSDIQCCIPEESKPAASNKKVCTIDKAGYKTSGLNGECISRSACKSLGGTSTAGFCPGGTDNQCCTYGSCEGKGVAGTCQPTSSCTGTSVAGLCKGGNNIKCCTQNFKANHPGQI